MNYLKIFFKDSQNCYIIWARISANKTIFHNLGQHKYFVNWIKWLWHENRSRSYWNMGDPYRLNINIMTYILYKLVYNISRKTANIWNWSFTNLFLVITDQYWLRKCRTYLILPWCSLEHDIFVFLLKNFIMNFIVVPRRLLLSSQIVTICFHSHLQSFYMQYLFTYKRLWKIFYSFIFICLNNFFCKVTIKMVAYFFTTIEWQER